MTGAWPVVSASGQWSVSAWSVEAAY